MNNRHGKKTSSCKNAMKLIIKWPKEIRVSFSNILTHRQLRNNQSLKKKCQRMWSLRLIRIQPRFAWMSGSMALTQTNYFTTNTKTTLERRNNLRNVMIKKLITNTVLSNQSSIRISKCMRLFLKPINWWREHSDKKLLKVWNQSDHHRI